MNKTWKLDVPEYASKYLYFEIYTYKNVVDVDIGILYISCACICILWQYSGKSMML
jgi:hypothetical protein